MTYCSVSFLRLIDIVICLEQNGALRVNDRIGELEIQIGLRARFFNWVGRGSPIDTV